MKSHFQSKTETGSSLPMVLVVATGLTFAAAGVVNLVQNRNKYGLEAKRSTALRDKLANTLERALLNGPAIAASKDIATTSLPMYQKCSASGSAQDCVPNKTKETEWRSADPWKQVSGFPLALKDLSGVIQLSADEKKRSTFDENFQQCTGADADKCPFAVTAYVNPVCAANSPSCDVADLYNFYLIVSPTQGGAVRKKYQMSTKAAFGDLSCASGTVQVGVNGNNEPICTTSGACPAGQALVSIDATSKLRTCDTISSTTTALSTNYTNVTNVANYASQIINATPYTCGVKPLIAMNGDGSTQACASTSPFKISSFNLTVKYQGLESSGPWATTYLCGNTGKDSQNACGTTASAYANCKVTKVWQGYDNDAGMYGLSQLPTGQWALWVNGYDKGATGIWYSVAIQCSSF